MNVFRTKVVVVFLVLLTTVSCSTNSEPVEKELSEEEKVIKSFESFIKQATARQDEAKAMFKDPVITLWKIPSQNEALSQEQIRKAKGVVWTSDNLKKYDNWTVVFKSYDVKQTGSVLTPLVGHVELRATYQTVYQVNTRNRRKGDVLSSHGREYKLVFAPTPGGSWEWRSGVRSKMEDSSGDSFSDVMRPEHEYLELQPHLKVLFGL